VRRLSPAALAAALFVYLTAELFPIGVQDVIAADLDTSEARVGLLLTAYAVVVGVTTLPVVHVAQRLSPRAAMGAAMALLAVAQLGSGLAPGLATLAVTRALAAVGHGLVWSQAPVLAVRLAPAGHGGRWTSVVFLGASTALLLGTPLASAAGALVGWRATAIGIGVAAAVVAVVLVRVLPRAVGDVPESGARSRGVGRPVALVGSVTAVLVLGHYVSYGYLGPVLGAGADDLAVWLGLFGVTGLVAVTVVGRFVDDHPWAVAVAVLLGLVAAFVAIAVTTTGPSPVVVGAVVCWGAAAAAMPIMLNTAAIRSADDGGRRASAVYVVAYQVGIACGAGAGSEILSRVGPGALPVWSAVICGVAAALVGLRPAVFGRRPSRRSRPLTGT
jgi:predicted MFS family arabinose efflux permease